MSQIPFVFENDLTASLSGIRYWALSAGGSPKNASLSKQIPRFSGTVLGVAPQQAQDSYPPLVWPQRCSDKVPEGLSKNILKKFKRNMLAKLPPGFTFAGDETH